MLSPMQHVLEQPENDLKNTSQSCSLKNHSLGGNAKVGGDSRSFSWPFPLLRLEEARREEADCQLHVSESPQC